MKKRIWSIVTALSLLVLILAGCGGGNNDTPGGNGGNDAPGQNTPAPDNGESYNLIVSLTKGQTNTTALQEYLAGIEQASGGRLTFEIYYNNQLMQVPEIPQGLDTGVADITEFMLSEFPTMFPLSSTIVGLPFMGMTNDTIKTFQQLYDEYPEIQKEFEDAGMVMLSYLCTQPYNIHLTSDKPVKVPDDLNGLKIITSRTDISNFLTAHGASAVASAPPDYYSNLSNGVVNGTILHYPMMFNNGLIPTCKQHVIVEEGGGIYMDTSVYVISSGAWSKLPAELQAYFTDPDRLERFFTYNQETLEADGTKGLEESSAQGHVVSYLSAEELAAWQEAFAPINGQTLAGLDEQGLPATQIYERAQEIIQELKG